MGTKNSTNFYDADLGELLGAGINNGAVGD